MHLFPLIFVLVSAAIARAGDGHQGMEVPTDSLSKYAECQGTLNSKTHPTQFCPSGKDMSLTYILSNLIELNRYKICIIERHPCGIYLSARRCSFATGRRLPCLCPHRRRNIQGGRECFTHWINFSSWPHKSSPEL